MPSAFYLWKEVVSVYTFDIDIGMLIHIHINNDEIESPHLLGPHDGEASVALVLDPSPPLPQLGRPVLHRGGGAPSARAGGRGHHAPALGGGLRHSPAGVL